MDDRQTPASSGYRLPAEWETHEATWIAWPHNRGDWPGKLVPIYWVYAEIVRKLIGGEKVRILVNSKAHEGRARRALGRAGVGLSEVEFFRIQTNRSWTRDYGPIFLSRAGARPGSAVVRFRFNGWARYPDWARDDRVAERVAGRLGLPLFRAAVNRRLFVLEGGAVDGNGQGALLTTEQCVLEGGSRARNPGLGRAEIEGVLRDQLGADQVLWLAGGIEGDDTQGHVDNVCRFVGPRTVVLPRANDPRDADYPVLEENRERLEGARLPNGSRVELVSLPTPSPQVFDGRRLPAGYANFYISNETVLVPTYNDPNDRIALGVLAELFSGRKVAGIHSVDLIWGLGGIHCMTREQPGQS